MCAIDWTALGNWMQALAGFAGAGAVVFAAVIGRASFDNWLRQRKTERKLEVGERILSFAHRAKSAFTAIRSPASFRYEQSAALERIEKEKIDCLPEQKRRLITSLTIDSRMIEHNDLWKELFECLTLASIFFGTEMEGAVRTFWEQRNVVRVAAMMYWDSPPGDFRDKCERDFWEGVGGVGNPPSGDEVAAAVKVAFTAIERQILPLVSDREGT